MRTVAHIVRCVRKRLPRRPRRHWRYVSPRRRGAGVVVLAMLLSGVYGYWYLTNDARIRRQARRYLRRLTQARVTIDDAKFHLFGDIELYGVRVQIPSRWGRLPLFSARSVRLRHRPWSIFLTGQVRPMEIICSDSEVEYNRQAVQRHLAFMSSRAGVEGGGGLGPLPPIRMLHCRYRPVEMIEGVAWPGETMVWDIVMARRGGVYEVRLAEHRQDRKPSEAGAKVDLASGQITDYWVSGEIPSLARALPRQYRKWRRTYGITGRVRLKGRYDARANAPDAPGLELKLLDVAFKLPKAQGDLTLTDVRGTLAFTLPGDSKTATRPKGGVQLRNITGRIAEAGGAKFRLSGEYHGYEPTDPFDIDVKVIDIAFPAKSGHPDLARVLGDLDGMYSPSGKMDIAATLRRAPDSRRVTVTGTASPRGMSATYKYVPYRIDGLTGEIHFSNRRVEIRNLRGTRDGGNFTIDGEVDLTDKGLADRYRIGVVITSARLDRAVRDALPEAAQAGWDAVSPSGRASARVAVAGKGGEEFPSVKVDVIAEGKASATYAGLPYPLRNITGTVHIADDLVWADSDNPLRAAGGRNMRCTIYGRIRSAGTTDAAVDVHLRAFDLPIDDVLADALGKRGRALEALRAGGMVRRMSADITRRPGRKLTYGVSAGLKDVRINPREFPYAVTGLGGTVTIDPQRLRIDDMTGLHGKTPVDISGCVFLPAAGRRRKPGLPPGAESRDAPRAGLDLAIGATGVVLDKDLFEAVPAGLKKVWEALRLSGTTDVHVVLRRNLPDLGDKPAYRVLMHPVRMNVTYDGFPYELRGVSGTVTATPGLVELTDLRCTQDKMTVRLRQGTIRGAGDRITLSLAARGVPIDRKLLRALRGDLAAAFGSVEPGGTLDLDLETVDIVAPPSKPAPRTAPAPATAPASRPAAPRPAAKWHARGSMWVNDATVDIVFGAKKLTGRLRGTVGRTAGGLAMDINAEMESITVGKHKLTKVHGHVTKKAKGLLVRVDDLSARAYGGRLAGREVMIHLSDPARYAFRLFYENVRLGDLVNAGVEDPKLRSDVKGRLDGDVRLEAVAGGSHTRRASGRVIISKGRLYKMPIVLGLMHVLYLSLPGDAAFTKGHLEYRIRGNTMVFEEIYLDGSAMSLVGSGSMDMKTEMLKLTFLAGPPGRIPRLQGLVTDVLKAVLKELLEIRVTGPLAKPRTKTVPLRSIDKILKELFRPSRRIK